MERSQSLSVLILEDSRDDARLIERALRMADITFTARIVDNRVDFVAALDGRRPDIALVDYTLPGFNGLAALRLLRQLAPGVPAIVVTGTLSDDLAVELLHEGASDYVLKDRLSRLGAAVAHCMERAKLEADHRVTQERLRVLFEHSRDGIAMLDASGGAILECNEQFAQQIGRELAQAKGASFWPLIAPTDPSSGRRLVSDAAEAEATGQVDVDVNLPDGGMRRLELSARAFSLRGQRFIQMISREHASRKTAAMKPAAARH